MPNLVKVAIGIQARSTSSRFPRKVFAEIDGKPILRHVIDACQSSADYINRRTAKDRVHASVYVVVPFGDEILDTFRRDAIILEGPESDVLTRYTALGKKTDADFVVRVTSDCPLIPPFLITKHIHCAIKNMYDYVSNVDDRVRTAMDGMDCEVISRKAMEWLDHHAMEDYDREHVTPLLRSQPPPWLRTAHVISFLDLSEVKLSVDTEKDLERVRSEYKRVKEKIDRAEELSGKHSVYRF